MESLPVETFLNISSWLTTADKLNCICVCKKWHDIITTNNLYTELDFYNQQDFDKAEVYFRRHSKAGKPVNQLSFGHQQDIGIDSDSLNIDDIFSLPELFPNVKSLCCKREISFPEKRSSSNQSQITFAAWDHLETLEDFTEDLYLCNSILQSGTFSHLKTLVITFVTDIGAPSSTDEGGEIISIPGFKALVHNIQHAPALECFSASRGFVDLSDIEVLHTNAPNLRELVLEEVTFENERIELEVLHRTIAPAHQLRKFRLMQSGTAYGFFINPSDTEALQHLIRWFAYFSRKYINLEDISIEPLARSTSDGLIMPRAMVQPVKSLVSCMPNLKAFGIGGYPLTKEVLREIHKYGARLEKLTILLWIDQDIRNQYSALKSSPQAEYLQELVIRNPKDMDLGPLSLGNTLFELCPSLPNLTHLTIEQEQDHGLYLFVSVFEKLPTLQSFEFNTLQFGSYYRPDLYASSDSKSQLRHLKFKLRNDKGSSHSIEQINATFGYILDMCPDLETFEMAAKAEGVRNAELHLDIRKNHKLKNIIINFHKFEFCICHRVHPGTRQVKDRKKRRVFHIQYNNSVQLDLINNKRVDFGEDDVYMW